MGACVCGETEGGGGRERVCVEAWVPLCMWVSMVWCRCGDGVCDGDMCGGVCDGDVCGGDALCQDSDGDGVPDHIDKDDDNDGAWRESCMYACMPAWRDDSCV